VEPGLLIGWATGNSMANPSPQKRVAMLCASDEVRGAFQQKYGEGESLITGAAADGRLALIATTSALGRSSIYNRLR